MDERAGKFTTRKCRGKTEKKEDDVFLRNRRREEDEKLSHLFLKCIER